MSLSIYGTMWFSLSLCPFLPPILLWLCFFFLCCIFFLFTIPPCIMYVEIYFWINFLSLQCIQFSETLFMFHFMFVPKLSYAAYFNVFWKLCHSSMLQCFNVLLNDHHLDYYSSELYFMHRICESSHISLILTPAAIFASILYLFYTVWSYWHLYYYLPHIILYQINHPHQANSIWINNWFSFETECIGNPRRCNFHVEQLNNFAEWIYGAAFTSSLVHILSVTCVSSYGFVALQYNIVCLKLDSYCRGVLWLPPSS
jgi:nitrate reductase NapE component